MFLEIWSSQKTKKLYESENLDFKFKVVFETTAECHISTILCCFFFLYMADMDATILGLNLKHMLLNWWTDLWRKWIVAYLLQKVAYVYIKSVNTRVVLNYIHLILSNHIKPDLE